jgi:hypothetical protein
MKQKKCRVTGVEGRGTSELKPETRNLESLHVARFQVSGFRFDRQT